MAGAPPPVDPAPRAAGRGGVPPPPRGRGGERRGPASAATVELTRVRRHLGASATSGRRVRRARSVSKRRCHHGRFVSDPFFIVGNDRSGTTMLRLIVDRGPDAAVPPESMFLTDFAPAFDAGEPRDAEAAARLMRQVWEHPKVRLWGLGPAPPAVPEGL